MPTTLNANSSLTPCVRCPIPLRPPRTLCNGWCTWWVHRKLACSEALLIGQLMLGIGTCRNSCWAWPGPFSDPGEKPNASFCERVSHQDWSSANPSRWLFFSCLRFPEIYQVANQSALLYIARILRYFASAGIIKETGKDTFASNNITETLTLPAVVGGMYH